MNISVKFLQKHENIIMLFFSLHLCAFFYLMHIKITFLGADNTAYIQAAQSILQYHTFSSMGDMQSPDNFRTFGFPFVIAVAYLINPLHYIQLIVIFQIILLYLMFIKIIQSSYMLNLKNKLLLILPFLFHPELLNLATSLQTEFLYVFTLFFFFFFFLKYIENKKLRDLLFSALFISLSLHIKPVYMFFIPVYLIYIFILDKSLKKVLLVLLTISIIIAPWIIRNKVTLDTYSFTSSKNFNLLCYAYSIQKAKENLTDMQAINKVDALISKRYHIGSNQSMLTLVASQKNDLIDDIIPKASKEIILNDMKYLPVVYLKGALRGFYLPHNIYDVAKNNPAHITNIINSIKEGHLSSIFVKDSKLQYSSIYFFALPVILNILVLIGFSLFSTLYIFKKSFRNQKSSFILLFVLYGLAVAFPWSNNSRYMMAYFPQMAIMFVYSLNFLIRNERKDAN